MKKIKIHKLSVLADSVVANQVSTIGECSVLNVGKQQLVTGNWFASRSKDNGAKWAYIDPYQYFPPKDDGFCCDQTVLHDTKTGLSFWLLQYDQKSNINNTLRLAVKKGATLHKDDWELWDFTPQSINPRWKDQWLDYNHAALSNNCLYICTNMFNSTSGEDVFTRCIVLRIALESLQNGDQLQLDYFESTRDFSLRCVQGATDTMYFAAHAGRTGRNQLRVFAWPEGQPKVTKTEIPITAWSDGDYVATCPDGSNWIERSDSRITGAWHSNGVLGFMWTVNQRGDKRPFPHVRVARINAATMSLIDEPDIWSPDYAFAYPDAYPNSNGDVGITLFSGGGTQHPTHVVGIFNPTGKQWDLAVVRKGTHGPIDNTWGDYITVRPLAPANKKWIAVGFTLQGGNKASFVEVHVAQFGRP